MRLSSRLLLFWFLGSVSSAQASTVTNLRCEYREQPLGIDVLNPRLSWVLQSDGRGERQTAYQILVASSPDLLALDRGDRWDSGKVTSNENDQIRYLGEPVGTRARCYWKVRTWDAVDQPSQWSSSSWWTMGLINGADWQAKWISPAALPAPATPLTIRHATYEGLHGEFPRDVTSLVAGSIKDDRLALKVTNESMGGEVAPNLHQQLVFEYEDASGRHSGKTPEGRTLSLAPAQPLPAPRYLRKVFTVTKAIRHATVYATALGLYELQLNGQRVGDHLLTPEWTDYRQRIQYQTYDATDQIKQGDNALGAILGNGWYGGRWQFWSSTLKSINNTPPYLLVQLEIEYADNTRQTIVSDGSWRGTFNGPLRFSGIYEGETYDARMETPGWDTASFKDDSWPPVAVASPLAGALVWQRSEPIRIEQEIKPLTVTEPKPGTFVFDLGQNIAGWCRLHLKEPAGTQVTLQLNEVLNPDGTVYMDNLHAGHLSDGDRQVIRYICRGGEETYEPHFTYQGFRYVQVSGLAAKPSLDLLVGCVFHTSFAQTGSFTCSNPLLNRLMLNIQWSQRANMMGVPTDCCQRDERCGYTGDMNFFIQTAVYNFDVAAFASKWLNDVGDSQNAKGWYTDFAPWYGGPGQGPNTGWSDAGVTCPYVIWQTYGDTQVIRDHYASMQRYLGYLAGNAETLLHLKGVNNGDWLNLGGGASKGVIGTAYDAYDFRLMAEMAHAIGEEKDAANYRAHSEEIARAFAQTYIDEQGRIKDSSQTGFALAFTMGLVPRAAQRQMSDQFATEIKRFHDHLATGFIGTPRLLPSLHLAGRDDLAYRLLLNETYPSWLYEVKNGATTMWERWNGYVPGKGYADPSMNSFNHYAFGSVGEYLYGMVGGIRPGSPGYKTILIAPVIQKGLDWANTSYDSIEGKITSNWKLAAGVLTLDVIIPPNTSATVYLPGNNDASVIEGSGPARSAPGVKFLRVENDLVTYQIDSGAYHFQTAYGPGDRN